MTHPAAANLDLVHGGNVNSLSSIAAGAIALAALAGAAHAEDGEALMKANNCTKCHSITTKKKGPAYKATAAEWKGAGVSVDKGVALIKEKHDDAPAKDADLKVIAAWILTL